MSFAVRLVLEVRKVTDMKRATIIQAVNAMFEQLLAKAANHEERLTLKRAQLKFTQDTLAFFGQLHVLDAQDPPV